MSKKVTKKEFKKGIDYIGNVCVFVCHDGKGNILMHKRGKACRDEVGTWDTGGGAVEFGEDFINTVTREIAEEYLTESLEVKYIDKFTILRKQDNVLTHWISFLFIAKVDPQKVQIGEPGKIGEIGWFNFGNFPKPLHSQLIKYLDAAREYIR